MDTHDSAHDSVHVRSLGPGQTVDTGDQLSSVVLLGIAVAGGIVSLLLTAIL